MSPHAMLEPGSFFDDAHQHATESLADGSLADYLRDCERKFILQTLEHNQGHLGNTAVALGISRKNLWEKMKKLDIQSDKAGE
jgi:DNA-binding NtrC family response regulator